MGFWGLFEVCARVLLSGCCFPVLLIFMGLGFGCGCSCGFVGLHTFGWSCCFYFSLGWIYLLPLLLSLCCRFLVRVLLGHIC